MDIGRLVNKKLIAASHIYRFTLKAAITNVTCLSVSDAEVFEFIAKPDARITRKPIRELGFPAEAIIGGIIRDNHGFVARGDTQIREGDRVVVFSLFGSLPYMFSGTVPGLTDAFFETVSGFATTGSSVVADADSMPKGWWASR